MKVIYSELKKRDDENYYQYIWRIDCLIREGKYKNWESVLPMVNSELYDDEAQYKGECAYRKPCKNARDFYENNVFSSSNIEELTRIKDEVRKERQKLSDERSALKKISRDSGRIEEDLDNLEKLIRSNGEKLFEPRYTLTVDSDNDMLVCLSDFHLGLNVDNTFGKYNSKIAEDRLNQYLIKIKEIKELHESEDCYLVFMGDLISGSIHVTTRLENRENVCEQIQKCGELLAAFVYELSKIFNNVYINSVAGNHSRIGKKDDVIRDERLDSLVPWYIEAKLSHIKNLCFIKDNYDSTMGKVVIRGKEYVVLHGDHDTFDESGAAKITMMIGHKPDVVVYGHKHKNSYDEVSGIQIVRSGSFAGTGDNFCVTKRIYGTPGQMICICDDNGVKAPYPIKLK